MAKHDGDELRTRGQDLHFSDVINKVQSVCILPNPRHIISIDTSISDIFTSSVKRLIEKDILLVDNENNSDCIGQHIMPYQEADANILSK